MLPIATFGSHTPCSTEDYQFEEFGPRASTLLIKIYTDYPTELEGFKDKEIDVMDWGLTAVDYQWFVANDPNHLQYSTAFYSEFGLFQFDVNNQVLPTSELSVRQGLSYLIDKDYFIAVYGGFMMKADSVLAAITGWYNPAVTDKYNIQPRSPANPYSDPLDWTRAFDLFTADLPLIVDPEDPTCMCWSWPTPFPAPSPSGSFPPVANNHLLVFAREEMPERTQQGVWLKQMLEVDFPIILPTLGKPCARMHVDLYIAKRAVEAPEVMGYYRYHLYTGGWSLGRDPDFLVYYTCAEITKPIEYGNNYIMYCNALFDTEVNLMLTSSTVGNSGLVCDGTYHAFLAQEIMMNDAALIPVWYFIGYKSYLSNWRGVINQIGFGTNSWWTFLNAYKVGHEGCDTIRYGWAGDLLSLNVITAQWLWDWECMNKIYDGLISVNPYDMSQDRAYLAKSWEISDWDGGTKTMITFHLREDIFWQDVPFKDRTIGDGHLDTSFINKPLTPLDVAFSIMYIKFFVSAWNGWLAGPVDHIELPYQYADCWPYTDPAQVPYWWDPEPYIDFPHDFFTFKSFDEMQTPPGISFDDETLEIYLNQKMSWIGLHWMGGIPITPMHIWQWVKYSEIVALNPWSEDLVYGTGPWILLDRIAGVSMTLIPFRCGESYRGITLSKTFFLQPVTVYKSVGQFRYEYGSEPIISNSMYMIQTLCNELAVPVNVTYQFDYDIWNYTGTTWVPYVMGLTTPRTITLQPYECRRIWEKIVVPPSKGTFPAGTWNKWFAIHDSFHWEYHALDHDWCCDYGDWGCSWWSDLQNIHSADIAGKILDPQYNYWDLQYECYLAANGIVNIGDAAVVGAHWGHTIPPNMANVKHTGTFDPGVNDDSGWCVRADLNNDGIINVGDAALLGLLWAKTWTTAVLPPNPPVPPYADCCDP
jgi:hypothetical protein